MGYFVVSGGNLLCVIGQLMMVIFMGNWAASGGIFYGLLGSELW
jgi:hypothetical protein